MLTWLSDTACLRCIALSVGEIRARMEVEPGTTRDRREAEGDEEQQHQHTVLDQYTAMPCD